MAGRQVLIDGYNVIRADPSLASLEARSLEEARESLTRSVSAWPRFLGDLVNIVFDGPGTRSFATREQHNHVSVTFPPAGVTADDLIKRLAQRSPDPRQVVVVTNDSDIRQFCEALGCTVTGAENLLGQLGSPRKMRRTGQKDDDYGGTSSGTPKKGNPRRLPKKLRGRRDFRF
jgi:uncharacterized protein